MCFRYNPATSPAWLGMNVLFEEDGNFKVASILSDTNGALQVEDARGKRFKLKANQVLLRFSGGALNEFLTAAEALAADVDVDFLWQCCPAEEFAFTDIATEYFGAASAEQQAATLLALHRAPMYFYRKGRGNYRAAPEENLKAALAGAEKKRLQQVQIDAWAEQLASGRVPAEWAPTLVYTLLHKPDKNTLEYKALDAAAQAMSVPPLKVFERAGALKDVQQYHFAAFLLDYFPKGTGFPEFPEPVLPTDLPLAPVQAFSIDDATTTEIDDAFSLRELEDGNLEVGIHIAAPTLGVLPDSILDAVVKQRLSTVYMPGNKITMLPEALVRHFTLEEGSARPALSLYLLLSPTNEILGSRTVLDAVPVVANLRHDSLEPLFNEATLAQDPGIDYPFKAELRRLWELALVLEKRRGASDNGPQRLDYNFVVTGEHIDIVARKRGSPMDKLVAELMIFVNSEWGRLLKEGGYAGIYRAQSAGKVRMTTEAAPHQGLGLEQYAWSSSPLRRAVDLCNQRQLLAMIAGEPPVYPKNSPLLFAVMRDFDQTYSAYAEFQTRMERYWCLRYLEQEGISELAVSVWREGLVRVDKLPLVLRVGGITEHPPGTHLRLRVLRIDYLQLEAELQVLGLDRAAGVLDTPVDVEADAEIETVVDVPPEVPV